FLDLRGVRALVVGGGEVAFRKAATLLECGADVTAVAVEFRPEFAELAGKLKLLERRFADTDLNGARLIFAATDDAGLNSKIAAAAKKAGVFVNVAAPPEAGDMQVPATVRRGRFSLAVSTGG